MFQIAVKNVSLGIFDPARCPRNPDFLGGFPPKPRSVLRNRQGIPRLSGVSSRAHEGETHRQQCAQGQARGPGYRLAVVSLTRVEEPLLSMMRSIRGTGIEYLLGALDRHARFADHDGRAATEPSRFAKARARRFHPRTMINRSRCRHISTFLDSFRHVTPDSLLSELAISQRSTMCRGDRPL